MGNRGWSGNELSKRTGLSSAWVTVTINQGQRGRQPQRDTLVRIAQAFGQPVAKWLRLGGLAPEDGDDQMPLVPFGDMIDARPELTDQQKDTLKTVYASMVPLGTTGKIERRRPRRG
jgi:transcriptional regulator with XRE-family HTH domain